MNELESDIAQLENKIEQLFHDTYEHLNRSETKGLGPNDLEPNWGVVNTNIEILNEYLTELRTLKRVKQLS